LLISARQRSGHPVIGFGTIDKRAVKHFPARVDINHGPIKSPADHFAGTTVTDDASFRGWNIGAGHDCSLNSIPRQCALSRGKSVRVSLAQPRRLIIPSGIIVPDERPPVSGMLVKAATVRAVGKQQQRSANEKTSRGHSLLFFSTQSPATQQRFNALEKSKARSNPTSKFCFALSLLRHFELAHQFERFVALVDLIHR
jgi:hypothetical protein